MISLSIEKIGVVAQGINNWQEASALLQGEDDYQGGELPPLKPSMLKPNERRRTTRTIKIALQAAEEALQGFTGSESLASVFSSSEGDLDIIDQICLALTEEGRPVSPTQFHNSVHNAPAGYWSIGAGARQGSSSLGGLNGSFAAGLMEAAVQSVVEQIPVLLVCYDQPPPELLKSFMPITEPFAVAMLLNGESDSPLARLNLNTRPDGSESQLSKPALEKLRQSAPSTRSLPMLQAIARHQSAEITLPYLPGLNLQVELQPC
ncbi:MAG: beta-ketoacyl synthase chain length factor [Candidatus Thiodiazotropha endolucinida]|nr:beta-ketoacyl synthase chain length factor [Candidatus Thiodiazotropha taylori]MCG8050715.1 beta-ketoacyl synthase chain length factor [Candidatus Thiodiazotropha taylori]MCW4312534.1 beta-ketoacyl synthase chain length factor [Candidatus Thiodiazotropha taylori]MCW4323743.1 beta-ketoacyl synthase chain length factor [Candidatus Thiodiazotropha taylori]